MVDLRKPCETCEDPRHPNKVTVLFNSDGNPVACKIGSAYHGLPDADGKIKFGAHTYIIRNVAPKPVRHEIFINLFQDGTVATWRTAKLADSSTNINRVECRRIVWNSDGSPVEGE